MNNKYQFHKHELMHTASVIMDTFDRHCLERTLKDGDVKMLSPKTKKAAQTAFDGLFEFYQCMGEECIDKKILKKVKAMRV